MGHWILWEMCNLHLLYFSDWIYFSFQGSNPSRYLRQKGACWEVITAILIDAQEEEKMITWVVWGLEMQKGLRLLFSTQSWLIPPPAPSAPLCTPATLSLLTGLLWVSVLITSRHRAQNRWPRPCSTKLNQAHNTDTNFPWVSLFNLQGKRVWWPSLFQSLNHPAACRSLPLSSGPA